MKILRVGEEEATEGGASITGEVSNAESCTKYGNNLRLPTGDLEKACKSGSCATKVVLFELITHTPAKGFSDVTVELLEGYSHTWLYCSYL